MAKNYGSASPFTVALLREAMTSVRVAYLAAKANNVDATNINGRLSLTQLPTEVLTNSATNVNLIGTFSGDGTGLTNVRAALFAQVISGTNQTLSGPGSYLLTNAASTTVTLPASPNLGDIITVSGVGVSGWQVKGGPSPDHSRSRTNYRRPDIWAASETNHTWQCVASSADGTKLVAAIQGGQIYTSTNAGVTWTAQNSGNHAWQCVASSADGTKLVAAFKASTSKAAKRIPTSTDQV